MSELKPCPFCGGKVGIKDWTCGYESGTTVQCAECGASVNDGVENGDGWHDRAITAWNRRAHPSNEPLTLEQMRQMDTDMENRPWVWIEVLKPFKYELKTSAYYQVQSDCTHDRAFCCGYPGLGFAFDYDDYGKTWLAYRRKPEGSENDAKV